MIDQVKSLIFTKPGSRFYAFLTCLAIAILFWTLKASDKTYQHFVSLPLKYSEVPKGYEFLEIPASRIQLKINSDGLNLFRSPFRDSLDIKVSQLNWRYRRGKRVYFIHPTALSESIGKIMNKDFHLSSIISDTLFVNLEKSLTKEIPIKWNGEITAKEAFKMVGDPVFDPSFIQVTGPFSVVDTMQFAYVVRTDLQDLSEEISLPVEIDPSGAAFLSFSHSKVEATIQIDRLTEKQITAHVTAVNIPDSVNIKLIPNECEITIQLPLSLFESINADDILVTADVFETLSMQSDKLYLRVEKLPKGLEVIGIYPEYVEFILMISND